jgi:transcription-repair coupling factor (superfamily II helicase)
MLPDDDAVVWASVEANCQAVAEAHELVQPGERFALTDDQRTAVETINAGLDDGELEFLLKAPTGSGKTEVIMRVAIETVLATDGYVVVLAPTRDLIRQHVTYFSDRLAGTGLGVGQLHGGVPPGERRETEEGLASGAVRFVIGSAMMLTVDRLWDVVDRSELTVIDDVNAFDEREHLRLLEDLDAPMLFASATPNELRGFLTRVGAFENVVQMRKMPFNVLPTKVHKVEGVWGEPPAEQLSRADGLIRDHLARGSRIFVVGRTRGDVPRLARRLEETYDIDVQQLRGDMADTKEHSRRNRGRGVRVHEAGTRVEMMQRFRESSPSMLAATNLIGSGIDIPAADLIVITDADAFGESEVEQLIGRVGRRERPSDAVMIQHTTFERNPSRAAGGGRAQSFMPRGMRANRFDFGRRR